MNRTIALLIFIAAALPLAAQTNCSYSVTPAVANVGNGETEGSVQVREVAQRAGCRYTVVSNASWIRITFGQDGGGILGSFGYVIERSTFAQARTGTVTVNNATFTVTQAAANCSFVMTPSSATIGPAGGNREVQVQTTCTWTASSSDAWLTVPPLQPVTGNGSFSWTAQRTTVPRIGRIAVGNVLFTVNQGCDTTLAPQSANAPAAGGQGSVEVTSGCPVTVAAPAEAPWLTATAQGTTVIWRAAANTAAQPRSATLRILDREFTVAQAGAGCSYSLNPTSATAPAAGSIGQRVTVTATAGCTWRAESNAPWLRVDTSDASGFTWSAQSNLGAERTGAIAVGGQSFTVTQAGAARVTPTVAAVGNAASYARDGVSPGNLVVIGGTSLGPSTLAPFQITPDGRFFSTSVAGTRVFFDNVAASIVYTRADIVSAIAPYALEGRSTTRVSVEYQGVRSEEFTVPVLPATPAIFSLDTSGAGQGAILNQDFSVNRTTNPAAHGSIIQIYATGGGATDPASLDGAIALGPEYPRQKLDVTVTVDGVDAKVLYAGVAPALVAGVMQVNAEIPAGARAGEREVRIRVAGVESQPGLTVAIQ